MRACAGETQACAEAAAERVTFLEEQIAGLNAEAEKAAKDAEEALAAAQAEATRQLAALESEKGAALADVQAHLSTAKVRVKMLSGSPISTALASWSMALLWASVH